MIKNLTTLLLTMLVSGSLWTDTNKVDLNAACKDGVNTPKCDAALDLVFGKESRREVSSYVVTLKKLKKCRIERSIPQKEIRYVNEWVDLIQSGARDDLNRAYNNLGDLIDLTISTSSCYYKVNFTSLFAELLYRLGNPEEALQLFIKASKNSGLDSKYKSYLDKSIKKSTQRIEQNKRTNKNIQEIENTRDLQNDELVKKLRISLDKALQENQKLIEEIEVYAETIKLLENDIQDQTISLRSIEADRQYIFEELNDKQELSLVNSNREILNSIFWILILGFGITIIILFFLFDQNKKNSSTKKESNEENNTSHVSDYATIKKIKS